MNVPFRHHWWPGLLQTRGFMKEFVTPIVKCVKGRRELSFFTLTEYEEWKRNNNDGKGSGSIWAYNWAV